MARKIVYWLGLGVVAAAAAWAIWLSWRTVPTADPEGVTDRVRVLVGASALLVLPWAGRRSGLFGPVGSGITPRLVRVAGCAAVCGLGVSIVHLDRNAGAGGVLGSGTISWAREIAGLALLGAVAAIPPVIRALKPQADAGAVWGPAGVVALAAFVVLPMQVLTILYVAGILTATSRRSPLPSAPCHRHDNWPGHRPDHLRSTGDPVRYRPDRRYRPDHLPHFGGNPVSARHSGWHRGRMAAVGHRGSARTASAASPPGIARGRDRRSCRRLAHHGQRHGSRDHDDHRPAGRNCRRRSRWRRRRRSSAQVTTWRLLGRRNVRLEQVTARRARRLPPHFDR